MATYLSTELGGSANQTAAPVGYRAKATVYGARLKRLRATFTYNTQLTTDVLQIGNLPAGAVFAFGVINTSVSMGTATLAIGNASSTSKYKAAGSAITATDTPTLFGVATVAGASDTGSTAEETLIGTIGTASLPASGTLVVDVYYSMPN